MSLKEFSAETGSEITDDTQATAVDEFATLALDSIVESKTNPRTTFNPAKLQELVDSIAASGVHQAILVRPLPASRLRDTFEGRRKGTPLPTHEIVFGARRFRASKLAGKSHIPAIVRSLTDVEVLKIQLVENLQRDDLNELEEAVGYQRLIEDTGVAKEDLGTTLGKSRAYVYARLKLLDLSTESRDALAEGKIDASRALLIARIPDTKLQKKALTEATRENYDGGPALSVRAFQRWLRDNVMLRLEQARFNIKDETLHAGAGACKECPKRTGANPDLFSDVDGADICTDPKCYETKSQVHRDRLVARAEAKGLTVIEGKAAKAICKQHSSQLDGYSRLDQRRNDVDEAGPTLRKLLGKDAPVPVLIEHPYTKELIEAVPTAEAEAVLVAKGAIDTRQAGKSIEQKIERLRAEEGHQGPRGVRKAMFEAIKEAVRTTADEGAQALITADAVRAWLVRQVEQYDAAETLVDALNLMVDGDGYDAEEKTARAALHAASDANIFRALALFMASDEATWYSQSRHSQDATVMSSIAGVTGLDLDAVKVTAEAQRKALLREQIAELKAQEAPKKKVKEAAVLAPAAAKGKGAKKSTAPPAAHTPRARKKSKAEVQSEIAAAFQAIDKGKTDQAPDGAELTEGDALASPRQAADAAGPEAPAAATAGEVAPTFGVGDQVQVVDPSIKGRVGALGIVKAVLASGSLRIDFDGETSALACKPAAVRMVASAASGWPFPVKHGGAHE